MCTIRRCTLSHMCDLTPNSPPSPRLSLKCPTFAIPLKSRRMLVRKRYTTLSGFESLFTLNPPFTEVVNKFWHAMGGVMPALPLTTELRLSRLFSIASCSTLPPRSHSDSLTFNISMLRPSRRIIFRFEVLGRPLYCTAWSTCI